ncbi:ShlB/FhaC/HecB family hemolysin secretion/activation protein [Arcobacter sp. LA11]|uniref:ShlB/FhaC/HecB family hemolysin secretion/activation protein n=1 Tax=Arcobacter sp. LA11 TaxID=1898176 RepID=UPI000934B763|nr:ShlB/FhaC/HecB family hemolysin secretion/activation protein [Arcobacter sp. LA11]
MKTQLTKVITLSVLSASFLLGANVPNIGDVEKQIQTPKIKKEKPTLPEISTQKYKAPMIDSGKTIYIKGFSFSGNTHIKSEVLQNLAKEYENKELTFTQISELTSKITKLYREKGYFVARAYIPKQSIKERILEIAIIEGNYGELQLENNSLVKDSVVQGILDYAKRDNIVSTRTLEQSMLIINDTPGVQVTKADVMPGSKVGTSDFSISTKAAPKYDGYVLLDNAGSRYTGEHRLMAGVNFNSPFEIGDKISLSGLISQGTDLKNGRIAYSAPLMSNGLSGEVAYSQTNYSLVEEYENLDAKGNSKTLEATLKYPIIRTRVENLYTTLNIAHKDLKDEINANDDTTKKDTKSLTVGLEYDKAYSIGKFSSNSDIKFSFTHGHLSFDDSAKKEADKAGADTNGTYSKINLELSHNMLFTPKISLESSLQMQYALGNKNLDGSEDFSLGGAYGVKLYPSGEISAENGYLFNIELKHTLPNINELTHNVGVFYDRGRVFMADNTVGFESKSLQDIGLGYYASYKDFFGQMQVAWNFNSDDIESEPNENSKILFQAGWVF